eukprot:scaffold84944_cov18-Prasinocladus_malaysianus.AAC.1
MDAGGTDAMPLALRRIRVLIRVRVPVHRSYISRQNDRAVLVIIHTGENQKMAGGRVDGPKTKNLSSHPFRAPPVSRPVLEISCIARLGCRHRQPDMLR